MSQDGFKQQALQAMREQKLDEAVELLVRAIIADDRDSEAKALLGLAYSQKGLHTQAIRALQTATELTPQNPQFGYHLGQAHERAGNAEAAARAYAEVASQHPGHKPSRERLQAMGAVGAAALASATAAAPPEITLAASATQASYDPAAPAAPDATRQMNGAPAGDPSAQAPAVGEQTLWAPAPQPAGGPADQTLQTAAAPHAATATAPWATPPGTQYIPPVLEPPTDDEDECPEDTLNPLQSLIDWMQILLSPARFFRTQQLADGLKSPFMFILLMGFFSTPGLMLQAAKENEWPVGLSPIASVLFWVLFLPIASMIGILITGVVMSLVAGWFNGTGTYVQSCRVLVYAYHAPAPIIALVFGLIGFVVPGPEPSSPRAAYREPAVRVAALQLGPGALGSAPESERDLQTAREIEGLFQRIQANPNDQAAKQRLTQLLEEAGARAGAAGSGFTSTDPAVTARIEALQQEMETNPARRDAALAELTDLLRREELKARGQEGELEKLDRELKEAQAEAEAEQRRSAAPSSRVFTLGGFLLWLWTSVLAVVGISQVHEMEAWDAIKTIVVTNFFLMVMACFLIMAGVAAYLPSLTR